MGSTTFEIIKNALRANRLNLLEPEAKTVCLEYGIPTPTFELVKSAEAAQKAARKMGYPVVLKIVSPEIVHKTEVGGVLVGLKSAKEVKDGYGKVLRNVRRHVPRARIEGVLVQKMAPQSTEVIVGALKDPQFGQTLMFGLGGIFVEILRDVSFRIAPINEDDAYEMIRSIKAYPVLKGYRGQPPADEDALVNILLNASRLIMDHREIDQMDLNPIMVYEKGASVVDARIILSR